MPERNQKPTREEVAEEIQRFKERGGLVVQIMKEPDMPRTKVGEEYGTYEDIMNPQKTY